MATGNFYNKNANKIFAVLLPYETPIIDEDGNETDEMETHYPDDFEFDDLKTNIIDEIENKSEKLGYEISKNQDKYEHDYNRNYPGRYILGVYKTYDMGDIQLNTEIRIIIRSGYYQGANLDWEIEHEIDSNLYFEEDISLDEWLESTYYSDMSKGLRTMLYPKYIAKMKKIREELIELVESVFESISTPMEILARFSNGETMYKKIIS